MDNQPKISVIVPVYNVEKYLSQCLESLRKQTLKDIEIICINDGSTDQSLQILKEYCEKDNRFMLIDKQNAGYGAAVNDGIRHAKGKYIGIVESDDYAQSDMYEKLYYAAVQNYADVVKANFNFYKSDDNGEETTSYEALNLCSYNIVFNPLEEFQIFCVSPSIWSAIYKKSFLNENNILLTESSGASYQDTSFAFKVYQCAKKVYCIKDEVINYRIDNPNSSVHNSKKIYCVCDEFKEIERFIEQYGKENKETLYKIMERVKYISYMWNYYRLAEPYQYAFLEVFSNEVLLASKEGRLDEKYWSEEEWTTLQQILTDKDKFFEQTGKYYRGVKANILRKFNRKIEYYGFEKILQIYTHIYIYGAGKIGRKTLSYLEKLGYKHKVEGFVVTSKEQNENQVDDKPVFQISDVELNKEGVLVLLAVGESNQYDIALELEKKEGITFYLIYGHVKDVIMDV